MGSAECVCIDNYFRNTTTELCQGKACFSRYFVGGNFSYFVVLLTYFI